MTCHLAGGTHHAHYDFASEFCIFNDLAVTACTLVAQQKVQRILIVDGDVHQHIKAMAQPVFCRAIPRYLPPQRTARRTFLFAKPIATSLSMLPPAAATRNIRYCERGPEPDTAFARPDIVFYDAGVDIYEHAPLGLLNISNAGIRARDCLVLESCVTGTSWP
ncbi:hypothetical protein [Zhongshania sp.]|uniref:hypothetical protein n=1 Tax=Zhongshania sp. TaxID=1971902 RepID=UPI003569C30C